MTGQRNQGDENVKNKVLMATDLASIIIPGITRAHCLRDLPGIALIVCFLKVRYSQFMDLKFSCYDCSGQKWGRMF